jgi:hypothetical protein
MRWDREPWRKLYLNEPEEQRLWPVVTRGLRDYLLRRAGDDGVIYRRTEDPAESLIRSLGAHDNERDIVRDSVRVMLADGFLVHGTDLGLSIRNLRDAQERRTYEAKRKAAQREKKRAGNKLPSSAGTREGQPRDRCPDNVPGSDEMRSDEMRSDPPKAPQGGAGGVLDRIAKAYADGIAEGGHAPWSMPDPNHEAPIVRDALELHQPGLRGDAIDRWVKRSAETYRRMMSDAAEFQRGFRPSKWLEWLNSGGEKMQRRVKGNVEDPHPVRKFVESGDALPTPEELASKRKSSEERAAKLEAEKKRREELGQPLGGQ